MNKHKFSTKKYGIWLGIIIFIGLVFRLWSLNKPEGLWFDEYLTYELASRQFPFEMIKGIINDNCHAPFHYFFLRLWMEIFGNSDFSLRFSSLFTSILTIPVMYLAGKELDSRKIGIIAASFMAINSFAIYFSQEMRVYSLIALFSSLVLLSTLKIIKKPTAKNFTMFIGANLGILYTHTIGFVFVFWEIFFFAVYLFLKNKKILKPLFKSCLVIFIIYLPYLTNIYVQLTVGTKQFAQWWNNFTLAKPLFLLTDYFSPVLVNIVASPEKFLSLVITNKGINWAFVLFGLLPTSIAILGVINSLRHKKINLFLFLSCLGTIGIMIIAAIMGKMVFLTKYSIEIMPILLLLSAHGLIKIKGKSLSKFLIITFVGINLFYLIFSNVSAPKISRDEGHNIVGQFLNYSNLTSNDIVFSIYYKNSLYDKYFDSSRTKTFFIDKLNFVNYLSDKEVSLEESVKKGYSLYKDDFKNTDNAYFENRLKKEVINNMKVGSKLILVNLKSVAFLTDTQVIKIASNERGYKKIPFLFMAFSEVKNNSLAVLFKHLKYKGRYEKGSWEFYVFEK